MNTLPPEIVLQILGILKHEENSIAPLLTLNSQWFNCGISVLWGDDCLGEGKESELAKVHEDCRQIYASVIRSFNLTVNQRASQTAFRYLAFPELICLTIAFEPPTYEEDQIPGSLVSQDKIDLQPYLHSSLRYLWVTGYVNADLLGFPDTYCCHLRTLFITNINAHPHHTLEVLSRVLQNNGTVINVALTWKDPARRMAADIFNILAKHNNLRHLTTDGLVNKYLLETLSNSSPFTALRDLTIRVTDDALSSLLAIAGSIRDLKRLHLHMSERSDTSVLDSTVFSSISKLTGLHSLELSIHGSTEVMSNKDLLSLGTLTQLRELRLLSNDSSSFQAPHFTDSDFERLVANLPHLVVIKLKLTGSILTAVCLGILGKHCPLLEILYLAGHFDMMVLNPEKAPFLPRLTHLAVGAFIDTQSEIGAAYEHVLQIERLFPKLRGLKHFETIHSRDLPQDMAFSHWIIYYWEKGHRR
ncbi:hypothetical protein BDV34DRAFT_223953 [Aspergillus parasiticus]|uniref:F-box domain-containing protein n=1 Tax=Aspergillus parasiticus TaxID=5067 RepID=A0A5N6DPK9_ASPPA|nr:hypothetical protein BDV34DRAFT_223953 [Aspergillus parasiticus]